MFDRISILIPYRPDFGPRTTAFEWIKKFYNTMLPEANVCIIETNSNPCEAVDIGCESS